MLSKAASGGGFLVPTDVGEMITAAARAASMIAQVALELETESGETVGMALAGTHGSAAWTAESASYTPSDETITQANLASYKATSKIIVSEELRTDEAVELDAYLAFELGGRLGALEETAFTVGDGSGKPLGIVHASSPYTVVNAATGSSTAYKLADLVTVYKALPAAYRANATWLVNADDFGSLAGLADTAGGLVLPSLQFDPPSMFGRPVLVSADLPTPAASAKSLAFGDWKRAYCVRRVKGVGLTRQEELHSDTAKWATSFSLAWMGARSSRMRHGSWLTLRPRRGSVRPAEEQEDSAVGAANLPAVTRATRLRRQESGSVGVGVPALFPFASGCNRGASGRPLDVGRMSSGIYGIHPMRGFQADREDCR